MSNRTRYDYSSTSRVLPGDYSISDFCTRDNTNLFTELFCSDYPSVFILDDADQKLLFRVFDLEILLLWHRYDISTVAPYRKLVYFKDHLCWQVTISQSHKWVLHAVHLSLFSTFCTVCNCPFYKFHQSIFCQCNLTNNTLWLPACTIMACTIMHYYRSNNKAINTSATVLSNMWMSSFIFIIFFIIRLLIYEWHHTSSRFVSHIMVCYIQCFAITTNITALCGCQYVIVWEQQISSKYQWLPSLLCCYYMDDFTHSQYWLALHMYFKVSSEFHIAQSFLEGISHFAFVSSHML